MRKIFKDLHALSRFIRARLVQDRCMEVAASLTFTTLLALVPMLTIALTVFSAFPAFENFSVQIKIYLLNNLMPENAGVIIRYMQQFAESAARLTTVGIIFLTFTAMSMMLTIDKAFNVIWRVTRHRPLIKRLVIYWAVLTIAPLLIGASLSLTSWMAGLSMGHIKHVPAFGIAALKILPVLFATLAFTLLFRAVPNRHVPWKHALAGALFAAVVFEAMSRVFAYFIGHFNTYTLVYGAFATVPVFLIWIYLSWLAILFGAVLAASLSHWRTPAATHSSPVAQLLNALRVLQRMADGFEQGRLITVPELSEFLYLGYDTLEEILEKLGKAGIVYQAGENGWLLRRSINHIHANELLRLFVLERDAPAGLQDIDPLQQWLESCIRQLEHNTDITLKELFIRA